MLRTVFVALLCLGLSIGCLFGQASKTQPTIMVMPSDNWCIEHGFYDTYEDPETGKTIKTPEYKEAFQESQNVGLAISKIGELFSDRGFPLRDMEQRLKNIEQEKALDAAEEGGRGTKKTLKEQLLQQAKADIILYLNWEVTKEGPYKQVTFQLDAVDPYIAEQVGAASGTGPKNTGNLNVLLEEAVLANVTNLQSQMQDYFDDLNKNGRKVKLRVKVGQSSQYSLKDYCSSSNEFQIGQIFEDAIIYFQNNNESVSQSYNTGSKTTNTISFDLVRIPMFYERETAFGEGETEVAMDATDFAKKMTSLVTEKCQTLDRSQLNITGLGLGEASITLTSQ